MDKETLLSLFNNDSSSLDRFVSRVFDADLNAFNDVISFVETTLDDFGVAMPIVTQMNILIEELFTNVAKFSYPDSKGYCRIDIYLKDNDLYFKVIDSGVPFNPLLKDDPDISLGADERDIGGLGILMVKKLTNDVMYEYINNCNVLTLLKKLAR